MITDKLLELSPAQALTSTGDADSTKTLDFGADGDMASKELNLLVQVDTAFASAGAATLAATMKTSADGTNWTTLASLPAVAVSALTKGARPWGFVKVPYGVKRHFKLTYTVGTAAFTAGKVWATLTPSLENK